MAIARIIAALIFAVLSISTVRADVEHKLTYLLNSTATPLGAAAISGALARVNPTCSGSFTDTLPTAAAIFAQNPAMSGPGMGYELSLYNWSECTWKLSATDPNLCLALPVNGVGTCVSSTFLAPHENQTWWVFYAGAGTVEILAAKQYVAPAPPPGALLPAQGSPVTVNLPGSYSAAQFASGGITDIGTQMGSNGYAHPLYGPCPTSYAAPTNLGAPTYPGLIPVVCATVPAAADLWTAWHAVAAGQYGTVLYNSSMTFNWQVYSAGSNQFQITPLACEVWLHNTGVVFTGTSLDPFGNLQVCSGDVIQVIFNGSASVTMKKQ